MQVDSSVSVAEKRVHPRINDAGDGFASILMSLKQAFMRPVQLSGLSDCLFTLGGRQKWLFGFNCLSNREHQLYSFLEGCTVYPFTEDMLPNKDDENRVYIGISRFGRPFIETHFDNSQEKNNVKSSDLIYFGFINLSIDQIQQGCKLEQAAEHARKHNVSTVEKLILQMHDEQYWDMINTVKHGIDHVDPVIIFCEDSVFTNYASYNNLLGKNSKPKPGMLLDDLAQRGEDGKSLRKTEGDESVFIYCFYLLKKAGFRGEEFSGQQLTLNTLDRYFQKKIAELGRLVDKPITKVPALLIEQSELCRELKGQVRKAYFTYRKINGLCFYKSEHYNKRTALDFSVDGLPPSIYQTISQLYGINHSDYKKIDDYFPDVVDKACGKYQQELSSCQLNTLEQIIQIVVRACIHELNSDIGMTRGFRDLYQVQTLLRNGDNAQVAELPSSDYFCAVFASDEARNHLLRTKGLYCKVLTAISQRMVFNSWHYTPGQFVGMNEEGARHFYFPPRMSDSAVWSDQHHPGHVLANVRYAIRSPSSLVLAGKKYYGVMDIRLMRNSSAPYSDSEIMRAKEYTGYLRSIYQAIADFSVSRDIAYRINAFDKKWFAETSGEKG